MATVNPSASIMLFQHYAVTARIAEWGTEQQRAELLPRPVCEHYGVRDGGDHTILLGRVVDVHQNRLPADPAMVWHRRGFGRVEPV